MTRIITRMAVSLVIAGGTALAAVAVTAAPALANGQAYQAPGFPSPDASCVGTALDYGAHYGSDGEHWPNVVHGEIGPSVSGDATIDGPGAVGNFNSTLAQSHGAVWDCVP